MLSPQFLSFFLRHYLPFGRSRDMDDNNPDGVHIFMEKTTTHNISIIKGKGKKKKAKVQFSPKFKSVSHIFLFLLFHSMSLSWIELQWSEVALLKKWKWTCCVLFLLLCYACVCAYVRTYVIYTARAVQQIACIYFQYGERDSHTEPTSTGSTKERSSNTLQ